MPKFYAVKQGHVPGVYTTWGDCQKQVQGFPGNNYKSFHTLQDAENFVSSSVSKPPLGHAAPVTSPVSSQEEVSPARTTKDASERQLASTTPPRGFTSESQSSSPLISPLKNSQASPGVSPISSSQRKRGISDAVRADLLTGMFKMEYDGASKGNPGRAGGGALIRNPDGSPLAGVKVGCGVASCNSAEYRGLIEGLRAAQDIGIQRIRVQGDSMLVCHQIQGTWAVRKEHLADLCEQAKGLAGGFEEFSIQHVERAENAAADHLANQAVYLRDCQVAVVGAPDLPLSCGPFFGPDKDQNIEISTSPPKRPRLQTQNFVSSSDKLSTIFLDYMKRRRSRREIPEETDLSFLRKDKTQILPTKTVAKNSSCNGGLPRNNSVLSVCETIENWREEVCLRSLLLAQPIRTLENVRNFGGLKNARNLKTLREVPNVQNSRICENAERKSQRFKDIGSFRPTGFPKVRSRSRREGLPAGPSLDMRTSHGHGQHLTFFNGKGSQFSCFSKSPSSLSLLGNRNCHVNRLM